MDTTQERHTTNSIAEQELFFPQSSGTQGRNQHQTGQQPQPRWYENLSNNDDSPIAQTGSGVPAVNIIPATPTTVRSNSVRSNASYPEYPEHKQMSGALPEVTEEDNIYDPPSPDSKVPVRNTASTFDSPDRSKRDEDYYVSPVSEPAVPHHEAEYSHANVQPSSFDKGKAAEVYPERHETGYSYASEQPPSSSEKGKAVEAYPEHHDTEYSHANDQPSSFDKGKAAEAYPEPSVPHHDTGYSHENDHPSSFNKDKAAEAHLDSDERPPLPGPRPVSSEVPDFYAQEHGYGVDPKVQEQEDRDYAMALALQEEEEGEGPAPPLPQRPAKSSAGWDTDGPLSSNPFSAEEQDRALALRLQEEEGGPPPLPARPHPKAVAELLSREQEPPPFTRTPSIEGIMPPPKRQGSDFGMDDPSNPIHYARDPHKLITYLVPFPKPWLGAKPPPDDIPTRFLIYTPPPPPLQAPPEGVKEGVTHKVQRKWQAEVRQAKMSEAKTTSWAGFKAKCTRGVDKAMQYTTTSNLDYLARVTPPAKPPSAISRKLSLKGRGKKDKKDKAAEDDEKDSKEKSIEDSDGEPAEGRRDTDKLDEEKKGFEEKDADERAREEKLAVERAGHDDDYFQSKEKDEHDELLDDDPAHQSHETKKTVGVEEIVFVYSPSMNMTPEAMREEFINSMLRTKSKAQRDAIIATGLLPISLAIDTVMIAVSGLFEVNGKCIPVTPRTQIRIFAYDLQLCGHTSPSRAPRLRALLPNGSRRLQRSLRRSIPRSPRPRWRRRTSCSSASSLPTASMCWHATLKPSATALTLDSSPNTPRHLRKCKFFPPRPTNAYLALCE